MGRIPHRLALLALLAACGGEVEPLIPPEPPPPPGLLAFLADREALGDLGLYTVAPPHALEPTRRPAGEPPGLEKASWSPSGRWLATWREELLVLDADDDLAIHRRSLDGWPWWSPKGDWLALTTSQPRGIVFASMADESVSARFDGEVSDQPLWSPNGDAVLVPLVAGDFRDLELVRTDGHHLTLALPQPILAGYDWAPSGEFAVVAVAADGTDFHLALWMLPLDGGQGEMLLDGVADRTPSWLPISGRDQFVIRDEDDTLMFYDVDARASQPLLSATDGYRIVGNEILAWSAERVVIYCRRGDRLETAVERSRPSPLRPPTLSPTGRHLLVDTDGGLTHLDRKTGETRFLPRAPMAHARGSFSSDGRFVAFVFENPDEPYVDEGIDVYDLEGPPSPWRLGPWDDSVRLIGTELWGTARTLAFVVGGGALYLAELGGGPPELYLVHASRSNLRTIAWTEWQPITPTP